MLSRLSQIGRLLFVLFFVSLFFHSSQLSFAKEVTGMPSSVTIAGSLQSELGCPGDWQPECANTHLTYDAADDVWQGVFTIPAGSYEYKAALNDSWDENYGAGGIPGGANIALNLANETNVKFFYDDKSHWVTENVNSVIATVPGSFQAALGCPGDWQPDCLRSWLQDLDGDGIYTFATELLPAGSYEGKVAINESWDENYGVGGVPGGSNYQFTVPADNTLVTFHYNATTHILTIVVGEGASHDNNIFWDDLGHDSRNALYRTPGGPVTTHTTIALRFRAASGDLTEAKVRLWNDRTNTQMLLPMTLVADDGSYEWWEATVPASDVPTLYWYRFMAIDGTAIAYYEDDDQRTGGWGQTYGSSPDNGWQISVYDPTFNSPDWVKSAVIYQIFPDRFRDGDANNHLPEGSFHYGSNSSIYRSTETDWNTPVCDPRDGDGVCPNQYGDNFYGGDLQGVVDQLDYLQELGVTAIYFNPIFEAPSNHKYDTTDYSQVDDNFGDLALFQTLATEADARGMHLILDGVFNHTSSDSIYFDRYGRYDSVGACESEDSPYRDWYYFLPANPPGTGVCAGDTRYESWFGFDSLPKLRANNEVMREYIWSDGTDSIAPYWMQWADGWRLDVGADVDPGVANDPNNDYWEGFREAVQAVNPDAYIVGEEWGNGSSWFVGNEWDGTMNYQYSSAMLSFWRDTEFIDNDHNAGSSAGTLAPLTPSLLDERLHNWAERYPAEAYYAMMNLLGSHDTNRALIMLDEGPGKADPALYQDPNYDWSNAIERLKGVTILQFTLPGAPTVYYGDEVGLVAPATNDGSTLQDDPYNRIPYPWLDETGTPFYTHLQTEEGQANLRDHYTLLAAIRHAHPALSVGSFDTLLVDDSNLIYAFGRKMADSSDAALVLLNRANGDQTVTVNVAGYLPNGATFADALNGDVVYTVTSGELVVNVPAFSGSILVLTSDLATPPTAVADLTVSGEAHESVSLSWSTVAEADSYNVYRSLVSGGGYEWLANTTNTTYTDTGLTNAHPYYYVVTSQNDTTGLVSEWSNEVTGIPHHNLDTAWFNLQWPYEITHTITALTPTENIYGQLYIEGYTGGNGPAEGIWAQVGYGPVGSTPDETWNWVTMGFNVAAGNNDEFIGQFLPDMVGDYDYTTRYSSDGARTWYLADRTGPGYDMGEGGVLHVIPSDDATAPNAPQNLTIDGTTASSILLIWDANSEADLVGYELYRQPIGYGTFSRIATLPADATNYTDTDVVTDATYQYYLVAYDTSFNRSAASVIVEGTAENLMVGVTFRVGVPAYTPGTVFVVGDIPEFGPWNPGLVPMTEVEPGIWEYSLSIMDGTQLQYKFTRGTWDMVESWGSIVGLANRSTTIDYGESGSQIVDNTATDWGNGPDSTKAVQYWRDPIVASHYPADGDTNVSADTPITVTFSIPVYADSTFEVTDSEGTPVSGTFAYDEVSWSVAFTPDEPLQPTTYTVLVQGVMSGGVPGGDSGTQQVPALFSFAIEGAPTSVQLVSFGEDSYSTWWWGWNILMLLIGLGCLIYLKSQLRTPQR